jgi:hypothetical protein
MTRIAQGWSFCFRTGRRISQSLWSSLHHWVCNQEQGWKTEFWLEDTYDHLVVDRVDIRAGHLAIMYTGRGPCPTGS